MTVLITATAPGWLHWKLLAFIMIKPVQRFCTIEASQSRDVSCAVALQRQSCSDSVQCLVHYWGGILICMAGFHHHQKSSRSPSGVNTVFVLRCMPGYQSINQSINQGFYSLWGQLAHLTKLQSFIRKWNRQKVTQTGTIIIRKLSFCMKQTKVQQIDV